MSEKIYYMYKCDGCGQTLVVNSKHKIRRVSCGPCKKKPSNLKMGA